MRNSQTTGSCFFAAVTLAVSGLGLAQQRQAEPAQARATEIESLARQCATEIAWRFDFGKARAAAEEQGKPLVVYVRCVSNRDGYDSARQSLAAQDVPLHDDGYRKDLLFRACVLADPTVQALITEKLEPVCLTYHFESHGRGKPNIDWVFAGRDGGDGFAIDPAVGKQAPGSLRLSQSGSFLHTLLRPAMAAGKYRLSASVKTEELHGRTHLRVLWMEQGASKQGIAESTSITAADDWTRLEVEFELAAQPINVLVMPTLFGSGTAWFDDLELHQLQDGKSVGPNLIRNGHIDPDDGGSDPLIQLGQEAQTTITPALLVVQKGKAVRKLHRIGAMSPDYVQQWLRSCVDQPEPQGADGKIHAIQELLRKGAWTEALSQLTALREAGDAEGQFWEGLCLHRLGRHAEARARWQSAVGPTRWGRRSAACLLPRGPHPVLSLSERTWTAPQASISTESPESFDGRLALRILLEMQGEDGSFRSHYSQVVGGQMYDHWQAAFTGIAVEAIVAWQDHDAEREAKVAAALDRARKFLVAWSQRPPRGRLGAFNHPYAIRALLTLGEKAAAQRLVDRILSEQNADGSWSVYGPQRPTSFNTAQNILALVAASEAGLKVPQESIDKGCVALEGMRSGKLFPYSPVRGHEWMTTEFGSIARDPLCEHALLSAGKGNAQKLAGALERFLQFQQQLRAPTKHYSGYFNSQGHGSYFLLYALHNALEAAEQLEDKDLRAQVTTEVQQAMLAAAEKDSSAIDHAMYGRSYGTAMALLIFARGK